MQVSPRPLDRVLDGYRMQQRALTVEQLAQLAAQLHTDFDFNFSVTRTSRYGKKGTRID